MKQKQLKLLADEIKIAIQWRPRKNSRGCEKRSLVNKVSSFSLVSKTNKKYKAGDFRSVRIVFRIVQSQAESLWIYVLCTEYLNYVLRERQQLTFSW